MPDPTDKSLDILGVKPIASSIEKVVDGTVDGARAFLSRVCLPAAEEFGLFIRDNVVAWRAANAANIAAKAEAKLQQIGDAEELTGNPRVMCTALQAGSWTEDSVVQDFWAGLLASSCDADGRDDSNAVFVSLLSQLTTGQVHLLRYAVEHSPKFVTKAGWPYADPIRLSHDELMEIFGSTTYT